MNKRFLYTVLGTAAATAGYLGFVRPRLLRLGATDEEVRRPMLGDELVANPTYVSTRAVTCETHPETVWPWIVQMGEQRGGFYSYEVLDRLVDMKLHGAHRILPRYQDLDVGDELDLEGNIVVRAIEPEEAVVLGPGGHPSDFDVAWTIGVYPTPEGHTRLVSRVRAWFDTTSPRALAMLALADPVQLLLEQKFLQEIKTHAEGRSEKWPPEASLSVH